MLLKPGRSSSEPLRDGRGWRSQPLSTAALILVIAGTVSIVRGDADSLSDTYFYSTAAAPEDYRGPRPERLLLTSNDPTNTTATVEERIDRAVVRTGSNPPAPTASEGTPTPTPPPAELPPQVASVADRTAPGTATIRAVEPARVKPAPAPAPAPSVSTSPPPPDLITQAKKAIHDCQIRYTQIHDYTCTFMKRERIDGRLTQQHVMAMKLRTRPGSVYFKFQTPNRGREAIYVHGKYNGKVIAHDVGIGKLLAGTMHLDPRGSMAMEDTRHPITEAGIGSLIDTVAKHWAVELTPEESVIAFHPNIRVGNHPCTMIESDHPRRLPHFLYHKVKLYIDHEHGLPIRFEAYDWPKQPGAAPELIEEYTYLDLKTNVGLGDHDFDPNNKQYSYGRF
jgi:hypothetical protein